MAGFYRSRYKPTVDAAKSVPRDDEYHYMFSTQFESCDARRAFPCFDEPNLKATFDFEIVEDFTKRKYNGKNMPVRVYTTRGLKEQGRWALLNCHQVVDYFSEVQ